VSSHAFASSKTTTTTTTTSKFCYTHTCLADAVGNRGVHSTINELLNLFWLIPLRLCQGAGARGGRRGRDTQGRERERGRSGLCLAKVRGCVHTHTCAAHRRFSEEDVAPGEAARLSARSEPRRQQVDHGSFLARSRVQGVTLKGCILMQPRARARALSCRRGMWRERRGKLTRQNLVRVSHVASSPLSFHALYVHACSCNYRKRVSATESPQ
jgi:hypothetical protein